jgi:nitrogen fixation NifU-like protein
MGHDLYSSAVEQRFSAPRHAGRPDGDGFRCGRGGGVKQGSLLQLWLKLDDGRIVDARFEAFGCPSTIACGEWMCDWLIGTTIAGAEQLSGLQIAEALELAPAKRGVALVAEDALKAALVAPVEQNDSLRR